MHQASSELAPRHAPHSSYWMPTWEMFRIFGWQLEMHVTKTIPEDARQRITIGLLELIIRDTIGVIDVGDTRTMLDVNAREHDLNASKRVCAWARPLT